MIIKNKKGRKKGKKEGRKEGREKIKHCPTSSALSNSTISSEVHDILTLCADILPLIIITVIRKY